jgi:hypothetical protein
LEGKMRIKNLWIVVAFTMCFHPGRVRAQGISDLHGTSKIQRFSLWKTFDGTQKLLFLSGFLDGLITGVGLKECSDRSKEPMLDCLLAGEDLTLEQAVAMVDKYFKENPQRWDVPIGDAILEALTVKDGPCREAGPRRQP